MAHIDGFKRWTETIRQDLDAFKALLESAKADKHARKLAGSALQYLVSRMDLIPDWNEGIGMIDDVMVLRVCAQVSQGTERGALAATHEAALERMANDAEKISEFLGAKLYDKLASYCAKLIEQQVRGHTPGDLLDDEAARKDLYTAIDDELKKSVPIVINDPKDAELRLTSYLTQKLQ